MYKWTLIYIDQSKSDLVIKAILATAVGLQTIYAFQKVIRSSQSVFAISLLAFSMLYSIDLLTFMWFGAKVTIPGLSLDAFI